MPDKRFVHIFIDNTNVFEEGKRASHVRMGKSRKYKDQEYVLDYGALLQVVMDGGYLAALPKMYGSEPPPNDTVWQRIRDEGFDLTVFKRNIFGREKGLDMEMGLAMSDLVHEKRMAGEPPGTVCIVAGDADYIPVVRRLKNAGWRTEVWYWDNAARQLVDAVDRFESLNPHIDVIGTRPRKKSRRRRSTR